MAKNKKKIRTCEICGEEKLIYAKGRCLSCYNKMRHYGVETAEELKEKINNNRRSLAKRRKEAEKVFIDSEVQTDAKKRGRKRILNKESTPCKICGEIGIMSSGMCSKCYRIAMKNKTRNANEILALRNKDSSSRNRKYAKDAKCLVCGKKGIYARGLCKNCYCAIKNAGVNTDEEFAEFFKNLDKSPDSVPFILRRKEFNLE